MATPKKPKAAGERTKKSKAKKAIISVIEGPASAATTLNGNGAAPSIETIRLRAYEVFVSRGEAAGDELSDWLTAEREIMEIFLPHD
jgi:hypothetical protein